MLDLLIYYAKMKVESCSKGYLFLEKLMGIPC